jgi:hypothetical protein
MRALQKHWFDLGLLLSVLLILRLTTLHQQLETLQLLAVVHLITLLFHQFEEYRWPGYFPGFVNTTMYKSSLRDRFPLNARSALVINVYLGWTAFSIGVLYWDLIWLNIALSLVSMGNCIAHIALFNAKGKTLYNPGMATSVFLFLPYIVCD